ncbi:hypothetical protein J5Y04_26095 [Kitasatospora sp. RG8]|uniref:hypothetical protein n=1 Tax=Kitasatospora sp. RG8 TaxID=2820815 RepID=UPI001AE07A39|nr:hypothetical protein [Kitasatospora sp. RG8]MBP0452991.1 hypothetical protein [Kitasatospora sp. RG8]
MASSSEQELSAPIRNAASAAWSVRAAAGRQLAASDRIDEVADVIHRLLLDAEDTAVTQQTAEALLARRDTAGLRCVLMARSQAAETWTADEIQAALDCDPDWMTTEGADRLIRQVHELAADEDADVRDEAQRILARLRPRSR